MRSDFSQILAKQKIKSRSARLPIVRSRGKPPNARSGIGGFGASAHAPPRTFPGTSASPQNQHDKSRRPNNASLRHSSFGFLSDFVIRFSDFPQLVLPPRIERG